MPISIPGGVGLHRSSRAALAMEMLVEPLLDHRPEIQRVGTLRAGDADPDAGAAGADADDVPFLIPEEGHADLADASGMVPLSSAGGALGKGENDLRAPPLAESYTAIC